MIVLYAILLPRTVNNQGAAVLDIFKSFERFVQVPHQFRKFVCPCLTYVGFVHNQNYLHPLVNIQQSLNEKRVRYFVLLPLVVLESRAVVEGHLVYDNFCGN